MSAYIVDDKTINRILAAAEHYTHHKSDMTIFPPAPQEITCPHPTFLDWTLVGSSMREMNVVAVIARYGPTKPFPGPCPLLPYQYQSVGMTPSPIQVIKSLACYLYQCSEGDIPERLLYKQLREWQAALCQHYVSQSDAWQQAEWA